LHEPPKPSVERCETITISRKVAEEWLDWIKQFEGTDFNRNYPKDILMIEAIRLALSKEET
jgi:hypothetical protein